MPPPTVTRWVELTTAAHAFTMKLPWGRSGPRVQASSPRASTSVVVVVVVVEHLGGGGGVGAAQHVDVTGLHGHVRGEVPRVDQLAVLRPAGARVVEV